MKALKIIRRIISILTCVILVFMCSTTSFAETEENENPAVTVKSIDAEYPVIIIQGIKFDQQYVDMGTENERGYLSDITVQSVASAVIKAGAKGLFSLSKDVFIDEILSYCKDAFKYISSDKNGDSVYNVSTKKYTQSMANYNDYPRGSTNEEGILKTAIARYGADMCYYYSYDWRIDPLDNSDEINELVETAKNDHGCDKVNFISASLGGVNALAYLYKYGYGSVKSCVFLSTTIYGTYVATDLLKGNIDFNSEILYNFLNCMLEDSPVAQFAIKALYKTGFFKGVCSTLNNLAADYSDEIYDEVLRDTFATAPSLWSVVKSDEYEECIEYVFPTDELKIEYSGLIERADALQDMLSKRDELLDEAVENGMSMSIVAGYNTALIPAYSRASTQGDGTLETALMAGGATVSDFGKTFGDDYTVSNSELLSPDKSVDMSTARFPEYTWLIKDSPHVACLFGSDYSEFVFTLVDSKVQPSITTLDGYSRFMCVDRNQNFTEFK